ncbi:response regulator transcription factor [Amycolatopsis sp. NPDC051071]|uniref:response regulator transcription factor n=1 Tax=Amycolatopsis sp. NPDC051071 TaxID=3154637 RepID=UPI00342ACAB2
MIRVLIAEDQVLVRGALALLLELEPDIQVVAVVGDGDEVADAAARTGPDVALLDVRMPRVDGLTAAAELRVRSPGCRVVMCTGFDRPGYLTRAIEAGAVGFVLKDIPPEDLLDTVRRVHDGERVIDPALAMRSVVTGPNPLTNRESQVVRIAADGGTIAEVAEKLHLSRGTVRNYLSSAIAKTGAGTRAEAARIADRFGWL